MREQQEVLKAMTAIAGAGFKQETILAPMNMGNSGEEETPPPPPPPPDEPGSGEQTPSSLGDSGEEEQPPIPAKP